MSRSRSPIDVGPASSRLLYQHDYSHQLQSYPLIVLATYHFRQAGHSPAAILAQEYGHRATLLFVIWRIFAAAYIRRALIK